MEIEQNAIARVAHEANRAFCQAIGDMSQVPWDEAEQWQKDSAIAGVILHTISPNLGASASHDAWMAHKVADGWVYGETKDADAKTHPCIVDFEALPFEQKMKDYLFRGVVHSLVHSHKKIDDK